MELLNLVLVVLLCAMHVHIGSTITVMVSGGTSTAGQNHSLTCTVSGAESDRITAYRWFKTNPQSSDEIHVGTNSTLSFTPLRPSDAGQYRCDITARPDRYYYYGRDITAMSYTEELRVKLQTPVVTVSAPEAVAVGSSPTLTCSIELSEAVDIEVTVNTVWSGPSGTQLTATPAVLMCGTTYTSTATLSSVEMSDSGVYTCRATINPQTSSFISASEGLAVESLSVCASATPSISQIPSVYLQLNGVNYTSGSCILITDIGEGDNALLCVTNNTQCCRGGDNPNGDGVGEWYFPNNIAVGILADRYYYGHTNFFYRNRGPSIVRLNRLGNPTSPTGLYRCEVPDSSGVNQTVYVNLISEAPISIHETVQPVATATTEQPYRDNRGTPQSSGGGTRDVKSDGDDCAAASGVVISLLVVAVVILSIAVIVLLVMRKQQHSTTTTTTDVDIKIKPGDPAYAYAPNEAYEQVYSENQLSVYEDVKCTELYEEVGSQSEK